MLIDTHCHINTMVKKDFDSTLTSEELSAAKVIVQEAADNQVFRIINVGTSLIESLNCIALAQQYDAVYATVGIHPNDCTSSWMDDFKELKVLVQKKEINRIVGIGEVGLDRHYPDYNLQRQKDAFKAQIELALENDLALVVHTRDAAEETLRSLEEFKGHITRGIIHCFSEQQYFADQVIAWNFALGIGGTITYPKNLYLRDIVCKISLENIVLETDAPFLPPQIIRGKKNHPLQVRTIAEYIAHLRSESFETIADTTTKNALRIFKIS
ncbi:MAG: TatD family hydrolase [Candidatus Dependentiae bacterium]|nr:TatD family hydrolase [Candidatus Dependentiae bacterium]